MAVLRFSLWHQFSTKCHKSLIVLIMSSIMLWVLAWHDPAIDEQHNEDIAYGQTSRRHIVYGRGYWLPLVLVRLIWSGIGGPRVANPAWVKSEPPFFLIMYSPALRWSIQLGCTTFLNGLNRPGGKSWSLWVGVLLRLWKVIQGK